VYLEEIIKCFTRLKPFAITDCIADCFQVKVRKKIKTTIIFNCKIKTKILSETKTNIQKSQQNSTSVSTHLHMQSDYQQRYNSFKIMFPAVKMSSATIPIQFPTGHNTSLSKTHDYRKFTFRTILFSARDSSVRIA